MISRLVTILIGLLVLSVPARTTRELQSLAQRIEKSELIVVGKLGSVEKKFSIVFDDYMDGLGADRWDYKWGIITIDSVLIGELPRGALKDPMIGVALHAGFVKDDRRVTRFPTPTSANEGDEGVWLLRRGQFIGYYGLATYDCFLPIDSLEAVKAALERVQNNGRRRRAPERQAVMEL